MKTFRFDPCLQWTYIDPIRLFCPPLINNAIQIPYEIFLSEILFLINYHLKKKQEIFFTWFLLFFHAPQTSNVLECKPGQKRLKKHKLMYIDNNSRDDDDTWMTS